MDSEDELYKEEELKYHLEFIQNRRLSHAGAVLNTIDPTEISFEDLDARFNDTDLPTDEYLASFDFLAHYEFENHQKEKKYLIRTDLVQKILFFLEEFDLESQNKFLLFLKNMAKAGPLYGFLLVESGYLIKLEFLWENHLIITIDTLKELFQNSILAERVALSFDCSLFLIKLCDDQATQAIDFLFDYLHIFDEFCYTDLLENIELLLFGDNNVYQYVFAKLLEIKINGNHKELITNLLTDDTFNALLLHEDEVLNLFIYIAQYLIDPVDFNVMLLYDSISRYINQIQFDQKTILLKFIPILIQDFTFDGNCITFISSLFETDIGNFVITMLLKSFIKAGPEIMELIDNKILLKNLMDSIEPHLTHYSFILFYMYMNSFYLVGDVNIYINNLLEYLFSISDDLSLFDDSIYHFSELPGCISELQNPGSDLEASVMMLEYCYVQNLQIVDKILRISDCEYHLIYFTIKYILDNKINLDDLINAHMKECLSLIQYEDNEEINALRTSIPQTSMKVKEIN